MKRKTYYEKAVSLIDELNRNGNGELEVFSCNNTSELSYTDKKGRKVLGSYLTDKELWLILCAIANYLR